MMWDIAFAFPIIISTDFLTLKNLFRWLYSDSAPPLNPTRAALTLNRNEEIYSKSISFFKHSKSKETPFALTRQWCIFTQNTASCSACTVKQQAWLLLNREHVHCVDCASPAAARGIVMPLLCLYNVAQIRKYCHFWGGVVRDKRQSSTRRVTGHVNQKEKNAPSVLSLETLRAEWGTTRRITTFGPARMNPKEKVRAICLTCFLYRQPMSKKSNRDTRSSPASPCIIPSSSHDSETFDKTFSNQQRFCT